MSSLRDDLHSLYAWIDRRARTSSQNVVPPLPIVLEGPGRYRFLPASSIAVQSLVPHALEVKLLTVAADYVERFPEFARRTFWQPAGTFHLNVAILSRLSMKPLAPEERRCILDRSAPALDWLDEQSPYEIAFTGVLLAADGTLMAIGEPVSDAPWTIRHRFIDAGMLDQQPLFHVTIARVLEELPENEWRGAITHTSQTHRHRVLGTVHVESAMLIEEREGFLHAPTCYDVLRRFTLR